jgi:hypothetical protein
MIDSREDWINLARMYARANGGGLLGGMVHNLQNTVHASIMQLELWNNQVEQGSDPDTGMLHKSLSRLQSTAQTQVQFCKDIEQRSFYLQEKEVPVHIPSFCHWLHRFWINNLFYKHHISLSISQDTDRIEHIILPPLLLTLCLEEPLKNSLEHCLGQDPKGSFQFNLQLSHGPETIVFTLTTETSLPTGIDPWQRGGTTKAGHLGLGLPLVGSLCEMSGWSCSLSGTKQSTRFSLELPLGTSRFPGTLPA